MNSAPVLPSTPGTSPTPGTPGPRGKHTTRPHDGTGGTGGTGGTTDFGSALAMLLAGSTLAGNLPGTPQAPGTAAEEQGASAPSAGVTETPALASGVSVAGSGSLAAALGGALAESVAVSGAVAPFTPITGAAATGAPTSPDIGTTGATPPPSLAPSGEPVAAGLRALTPVGSQRTGDGDPHAPSIAQLPSTARPARLGGPDAAQRETTPERAGGQVPGDPDAVVSRLASLAPQPTASPLAPQPTATTTTSASTGDAVTTAVLRQVFPQVTQLATTPGTHRISITLHPESLGEVKVTVVVRADGGVRVRLAAEASAADSAQARQALLQGAPELHRLLEAGGGDVRVVVQGAPLSDHAGSGSQSQNPAQQSHSQSQSQSQAQAQSQPQSQADDGRRRSSYTPDNPQNLPRAADVPIGATTTATTTTIAGSTPHPGRVDEHAGRLDRLM